MADAFDSLQTLAEIGVGVAGFSGVVTALQPGDIRESGLGRLRLSLVLLTSLGAVVGATFPVGLRLLGMEEPGLWRVASLVFATLSGLSILRFVRSRRALDPEALALVRAREQRVYSIGTFGVGWLVVAVLVVNALPGVVAPAAGVYYYAVLATIFLSCTFFYRAVFGPYRPL